MSDRRSSELKNKRDYLTSPGNHYPQSSLAAISKKRGTQQQARNHKQSTNQTLPCSLPNEDLIDPNRVCLSLTTATTKSAILSWSDRQASIRRLPSDRLDPRTKYSSLKSNCLVWLGKSKHYRSRHIQSIRLRNSFPTRS